MAHTMLMTARDAHGRERFECIECERVTLVTWPIVDEHGNQQGKFPLNVLVQGDATAQHTGNKGNDMTIGGFSAGVSK